jgi:RNA polymerase sigma-70 factor (ECF subfamily)
VNNDSSIVPSESDELIPTRATLIQRLQNWQDQASWQDFFDTYWKLIYGVARKGGLSESEAQDVVQETMMGVAKHILTFKYDPSVCSFKTWLLNMTRWRMADQFNRRGPVAHLTTPHNNETPNTQTTAELIDPSSQKLEALWDAEWEKNLFDAALANVKRRMEPENYQIFDFYVNKGWEPEKVARSFDISLNQVYVCKHRVSELIKTEVQRLAVEMV